MKKPEQEPSDIILQLQSRIQALEHENRLLKERMDEAGVTSNFRLQQYCVLKEIASIER